MYGYPYVVREPTKPLVHELEARSRRSRYVQRTTWKLCDDKRIYFSKLLRCGLSVAVAPQIVILLVRVQLP